jgi:G3E family GTPase
MIPLSLVTGFLGGGKTTLLQRLIERNQGSRLVFIFDPEAGELVDGAIAMLRANSAAVAASIQRTGWICWKI